MTTVETPTLLSVRDLAARLQVSRATAYRLIHTGEVPAVRVGGQLRVDPVELRDYLHRDRGDRPA
jgi:excisionase family DNA binding protein